MISPIKKIIISIDFSAKSLNALHTAVQMSKRHSAELHLLYVMDANQIFPVEGLLSPIVNVNEELIEKDLNLLNELAHSINLKKGVECTCHHRIGFPVHTLCEAAAELDCDLVVVPTESQDDGPGYLFDSNAYRILKNVGCSVLTVPAERQFGSFKKVLFPLRPEKDVVSKYNFARAIIKTNKAKVALLGLLDRSTSKKTKAIKKMVFQLRTWMKEDQISHVAGVVFNEDPATGAANTCKNMATDLVIINASTSRSLVEFFFGSYTQRMIRKQEFAVLCYQPKKILVQNHDNGDIPLQLSFG